jgi:uncharacterized protein
MPAEKETGQQTSKSGYDSLTCLKNEIEEFVEKFLPKPESQGKSNAKAVHDGLWGTLRLEPHEVGLIDTPLFQRLRQIRQTGVSYLTYPSTTHTRFEHTLGVMLQTKKLGEALNPSSSLANQESNDHRINQDVISKMRLAALLHDVGHGPFSHTSELVYSASPSIKEFKKDHPKASPHETLGYLIVASEKFQAFFSQVMQKNGHENFNATDLASHIVGDCDPNSDPCKGELLNGPFDADKLDYIFRDSHFSGLPLAADLDRLWYTIRVGKLPQDNNRPHLVVTQSGATALEQVFFAKMVLFSTVYQHHKVRACDCMFAGIIEYMRENDIGMRVRDKVLKFYSPSDFLWITDDAFLSFGFETEYETLHDLIHNLFFRRLLKRALIISRPTTKEKDVDRFDDLLNLSEDHAECRRIAEKIWDKSGKVCGKQEIFLDLPKRPNFSAADDTYIYHDDPVQTQHTKPITLNSLLKLGSWSEQYVKHRYRGHVFCPPEHREKVADAAKEILQEEFDVEFSPEATAWCAKKG